MGGLLGVLDDLTLRVNLQGKRSHILDDLVALLQRFALDVSDAYLPMLSIF